MHKTLYFNLNQDEKSVIFYNYFQTSKVQLILKDDLLFHHIGRISISILPGLMVQSYL